MRVFILLVCLIGCNALANHRVVSAFDLALARTAFAVARIQIEADNADDSDPASDECQNCYGTGKTGDGISICTVCNGTGKRNSSAAGDQSGGIPTAASPAVPGESKHSDGDAPGLDAPGNTPRVAIVSFSDLEEMGESIREELAAKLAECCEMQAAADMPKRRLYYGTIRNFACPACEKFMAEYKSGGRLTRAIDDHYELTEIDIPRARPGQQPTLVPRFWVEDGKTTLVGYGSDQQFLDWLKGLREEK